MNNPNNISFQLELVHSCYGKLYGIHGDYITESIKRWGASTRCEIAMVLGLLQPGDIVLDVGAHIGTYALAFASRVGPHGKVFAFEALPMHFQILEKNILLNGLNQTVQAYREIICEKPGNFQARIQTTNTGDCSFFPAESAGAKMTGITLDDWNQKHTPGPIRFLKTDTEGMELSVLRGARALLSEHTPIIYCEIHSHHLTQHGASPAQLADFLTNQGYELYRNGGEREASHDNFKIVRMKDIKEGGAFFDLLAIHVSDPRKPAL